MIVVGLTGSIGMGKSTTAGLFRAMGDAVHDADAAVHQLYQGPAVPLVAERFSHAVVDGVVDRRKLAASVVGDDTAMADLEAIVHPLVRADEAAFLDAARADGARLAILDIPLLFETARASEMDAVVVVSAPAGVQRARVLSRPGMSPARFAELLARQMPDAEKRRRAHAVVDTSRSVADAARQVASVRRMLVHLE